MLESEPLSVDDLLYHVLVVPRGTPTWGLAGASQATDPFFFLGYAFVLAIIRSLVRPFNLGYDVVVFCSVPKKFGRWRIVERSNFPSMEAAERASVLVREKVFSSGTS